MGSRVNPEGRTRDHHHASRADTLGKVRGRAHAILGGGPHAHQCDRPGGQLPDIPAPAHVQAVRRIGDQIESLGPLGVPRDDRANIAAPMNSLHRFEVKPADSCSQLTWPNPIPRQGAFQSVLRPQAEDLGTGLVRIALGQPGPGHPGRSLVHGRSHAAAIDDARSPRAVSTSSRVGTLRPARSANVQATRKARS